MSRQSSLVRSSGGLGGLSDEPPEIERIRSLDEQDDSPQKLSLRN